MKSWADEAWDDYLAWQEQDKKTLRRINALIKDIERNGPLVGIGHPEALKGNLQGFFSRHIDKKNRLVYQVEGEQIYIAQCKTHYSINTEDALASANRFMEIYDEAFKELAK